MSFGNGDPYRHVEFIKVEGSDKLWRWHCNGCGAGWKSMPRPPTLADAMIQEFFDHVRTSHDLTPADTADWHDGS